MARYQWRDGTYHDTPDPSDPGQMQEANYQSQLAAAQYRDAHPDETFDQRIVNSGLFVQNPTGTQPNPDNSGSNQSYNYNPEYFATEDTARRLAAQLGGTVLQQNAILGDKSGQFSQDQQNWMIQLPDGRIVNAGLEASNLLHGYSAEYVNQLIGRENVGGVAGQKNDPLAKNPPAANLAGVTANNLGINLGTGVPTPTPTNPGAGGGGFVYDNEKGMYVPVGSNPVTPGGPAATAAPINRTGSGVAGTSAIGRNAQDTGRGGDVHGRFLPGNENTAPLPGNFNPVTPQYDPQTGQVTWGPSTYPMVMNPATGQYEYQAPAAPPVPQPTQGGAPAPGGAPPAGGQAPGGSASQRLPNIGLPGSPSGVPNPGAIFGPSTSTYPYPTATASPDESAIAFESTGDPWRMFENERQIGHAWGRELLQESGTRANEAAQREFMQGATGDALTQWRLNNLGYTQGEAGAIMGADRLNALNYTPEDAAALQLTPDEIGHYDQGGNYRGVEGNWDRERGYFSQPIIDDLRTQASTEANQLRQLYNDQVGNVRGAVTGMKNEMNSAIDNGALGLSDEYNQNYHFTPQDEQAMATAAGRTVGNQTLAVKDELQRQANAAGTNAPLAMSTALARQRLTGDVAAADAMTQARIQARQLGLDTTQRKEETRLGAARDIAARRAAAAEAAGTAGLNAEQYLTNTGLNTYKTAADTGIDMSKYISETGMNLEDAINRQQVANSQWMAANRQSQTQFSQQQRFQQGQYTDTQAASRAKDIASQYRSDLDKAQSDIRQQQSQAQDKELQSAQQRLQTYASQTASGAEQARGAAQLKAAQGSTLDKLIGAGAGALAGAFAGEGGVYTRPTVATVGESEPEMVVKLGQYRRRNQPQYAAA